MGLRAVVLGTRQFVVLLVAVLFPAMSCSAGLEQPESPLAAPTVTWPTYPDWLVGVQWSVVSLEVDGETLLPPDGADVHVTFETTGRLSGNLGCNWFGTAWTGEEDDPGEIGISWTEMGCADVEDWFEVARLFHSVYEDGWHSAARAGTTGIVRFEAPDGVVLLAEAGGSGVGG
jgi:heat shock protein HslJ